MQKVKSERFFDNDNNNNTYYNNNNNKTREKEGKWFLRLYGWNKREVKTELCF